VEGVQTDMMAKAIGDLAKVRTKLDARTIAFGDASKDYGDVFRLIKANPPKSQNDVIKAKGQLSTAAARVFAEEDKIRTNKVLMEEMMK
jgi:hypothetical protein